MLTAPSSNVIPFPAADDDEKPQWGKAGCSDWLASIGDQVSAAEFKALFFLARRADEWTGEVGHKKGGIGAGYLSFTSGMDERQIERSLNACAARGIIEKIPGKRGRGHAAKYRLVTNLERWIKEDEDPE